MRPLFRLAAVLALALSAKAAKADYLATISFTRTGQSSPIFQFSIPEVLEQSLDFGPYRSRALVPVTIGSTTVLSYIYFAPTYIVFNSDDDGFESVPLTYGASNVAPHIYAGTYSVNYFDLDYGLGRGSGTLTISTTPEPSSIALLGSGLLGVLGVAKRRRM